MGHGIILPRVYAHFGIPPDIVVVVAARLVIGAQPLIHKNR